MPTEATADAAPYWDVFPKLIRVSMSNQMQSIPLSIRGDVSTPEFASSNLNVAQINASGAIECGLQPGAALIMVWRDANRDSVRHVQVEVYGNGAGSE